MKPCEVGIIGTAMFAEVDTEAQRLCNNLPSATSN